MARKVIDIGVVGNDGTGDSIRDSFRKVNDNFRELYSSLGLGERLTFRGLEDAPSSYAGQEGAVLTVNNTETGIQFKQLVAGTGIQLDTVTNSNEIAINTLFASISGDPHPQLGGNLSTKSGASQWRIYDLGTTNNPLLPIYQHEVVNKAYADGKVSLGGVDAIDPRTNAPNSAFGTMTGPLILSRHPIPSDDETYDGLIAATKQYVDNSAFGSVADLYVATSGSDERVGVSPALQGRALAYAYRSIEAALKRAEEIMLESRVEIGPYKKILTYGNNTAQCTLSSIATSPDSGTGFTGRVFMTVDTISISAKGTNYQIGDMISLAGGTGTPARVQVLATAGTPGGVISFKLITGGVYSVLPGNTAIPTLSDSQFGTGAKFDVTYKVNNIQILTGGNNYSLVSVRITNGVGDTSGSGAFGTAQVVGGAVTAITVTDQGSGFTALPTVTVDLPRFKLFTNGLRTDFTGNVTSSDLISARTRDVRDGLYLRGEDSGALAQILSHTGALDGLDEVFDVDIKYGAFKVGEVISYGDVTKLQQISVWIESGTYEENYPLKVPQNVAVLGDDFRRVIIKPKTGISSSPWAFQNFRREKTIDGNATSTQLFGYHYLTDSTQPVYPIVNNPGYYRAAAQLLYVNKTFIQNEITAWIKHQCTSAIAPFNALFVYNESLCARDVGLIVDAMIFDLKYGLYNRTVSAALKYKGPATLFGDPSVAIHAQLSQTVAAINYINTLAQQVITNTLVPTVYNTVKEQIVDLAYTAETGSGAVITALTGVITDIISNSGAVNYPKDNDQMDVFLVNDATMVRRVTCQGHGGFMAVLDPEGQILAKSPYYQESASFMRSTGRKRFGGGMFIDGFTGNLQFRITGAVSVNGNPSQTRFTVASLKRFPQLPASFIVNDTVYRINYVRDYVFSTTGSTAQFVLDLVTPFPYPVGAQTITSVTTGTPGVFNLQNHYLQVGATLIFASTGTLPTGLVAGKQYYVVATGFTANVFSVTDDSDSIVGIPITNAGSGTLTFERVYEVLMPGNRSMLANDYTQINDMGYGLMVTNGGLLEAVSVFTYYCYVSYYSLNGGQIRSVAGSSAHGVYALIAEGSDPLEIPTPVTMYYDLAQGVSCYFPSGAYANTVGGLVLYVNNYTYVPLNNSELEVIHSDGNIYRYSITSVSTADQPAGVARLNISTSGNSSAAGLSFVIPDGTLMTIRNNSQVVLTGDVVNVATRPSTALKLNETASSVYRVLLFEAFTDPVGGFACTISNGSPAIITAAGHNLLSGYQVTFSSTGTLPTGLSTSTKYYVIDAGLTSSTFRVSATKNGNPVATSSAGSGSFTYAPSGLARTTLRENYDYVELTAWAPNELVSRTTTATTTATSTVTMLTSTINSSGVLTVGSPNATIYVGMQLTGGSIAAGTYITANISGTGAGSTWQTSTTTTQSSTTITGTAYNITLTSTSGMYVGIPIVFGSTFGGLTQNLTYYIKTINGQVITVTSTPGGTTTPISNTSGNNVSVTAGGKGVPFTVNISTGATFLCNGHGLVAGDVIALSTTGALPTGLTTVKNYFVISSGLLTNSFKISATPGGTAIDTSGTQSGTHSFGKVQGRVGDTSFAVVPLGPIDKTRIVGMKVVWAGTEYTVANYQDETATGQAYGRITLNTGLVRDILFFSSSPTLKGGVPKRAAGASGTLTIRISLTRVTGHDMLEIGTGSYADTNYPNEIYGAAVNPLADSNEAQERGSGRVFYVTTDQFGNFRVGPYFRVDQGTGTVTFSAAIALSNLDGLGFKRGVPIAEFSTDTSMTGNRTDSVPTENAVRTFVERRLGITQAGTIVPSAQLIPITTGGFMSLDGQLAMKGNMDLGNHRILNVSDPVQPTDVVNLRSLVFSNFAEFATGNINANDILTFTGTGKQLINATIVGDISLNIDSTAHTLDAQINPGVITNVDINSSAGILQSKLSMTTASTRVNATGISQANLGLSSFDSAQFTATNGWITISDNGLVLTKIAQIASRTLLGNNSVTTDNVSTVSFGTVVDSGGAVKKSQFSGVGYLRRNNTGSNSSDADYTIVNDDSLLTVSTLVKRDTNGDFAARTITLQDIKLKLSTESTATSTLARTSTATGGSTRLYGFSGSGGVLVGSGSLAADNTTYYDNDFHSFRTQNGLNPAPITASKITLTTISSGGPTTTGYIEGRWQLSGTGSRMQATYSADLAEYYEGDKTYEVGTVLIFGGEKEVTISDTAEDHRIAGVVSDTAAYSMYGACPGEKNLIALQGRVPVKVVGKISKGDLLITSRIPGVAISVGGNARTGTVIGKALEDYNSDHIGKIEVAVGRT